MTAWEAARQARTGLAELESASGEVDSAFLQSAVEQAALLLGASGSAFYRCTPGQDELTLAASQGIDPTLLNCESLGRACVTARGITTMLPGGPAVLAVPCFFCGTVMGVLAVVGQDYGPAFDEHDLRAIQPLADLTAAMLNQAERLKRMTAQFRALHAIDVALTSSLQLDRVLRLILEKAVEMVGAEHGSLRLYNPATGELGLKAYLGEGWTPEVRAYVFRRGIGICGWVAQERRPYLCLDTRRDPCYVVLFDEMRSTVAVPLLTRGPGEPQDDGLLGVLLLESTRPGAFEQQDVELLTAMAQEAVIAIQNATQHEKLQEMNQALQDEQERRVAAEKWTVMGQAATALAHRINNLVGIVPVSVSEVRRTLSALTVPPGDRAWIEDNLGRIERSSTFVLRLSNTLFRPFQGEGTRGCFDVNQMLGEALPAANLAHDVRVTCHYSPALPRVECSSLLVDILVELISNAGKAMRDQPDKQLELRSRVEPRKPANGGESTGDEGQWVVVEVRDNGVGIAPERLAHLWDLFQPSTDGLGFGLWWVRTFIERQGGTISCQPGPEAGSVFTIRLPASMPGSGVSQGHENGRP